MAYINPIIASNARDLPHYAHMKSERFAIEKEQIPYSECKVDDIQKIIFAPDPVTGVPRSDLALLLNNQTSPEVAAYIREKLAFSTPSNHGLDNADDALEFARDAGESLADYAARLRSLCKPKESSK